jgi:F-type H+-transporting ATPase subunit delta
MTNRTAAARYARALFDVSVKDRDLRQVEADLAEFADLIDGHETLSRVLLNPAIPTHRKRAIVNALLGRLGDVTPPVAKLLTLMAERDRLALLSDVVRSYRARLLDHLGIVEAQVTTAQPLTSEQTAAIERSLAQVSGREVTMVADVDPDILGGVVARLGTTVYDGSVAGHLERIRNNLLAR